MANEKLRLVLTNKCNLNCAFCVDAANRNSDKENKFLSDEHIDEAIDFAK